MDHGDILHFSGKTYKYLVVENPIDKLKGSQRLTEDQKRAYIDVINAQLPIKKEIDFITAEQLCPGVNKVINWLERALASIPEKGNEELVRKLQVYYTFVSNTLSLFDQEEGMKFIPGFTQEALKASLSSIKNHIAAAGLRGQFDEIAGLIFKIEPMFPGANLYRFNSDRDKADFLESLGSDYASLQSELETARAQYNTDPTVGVRKIAPISQRMTEIQAQALKAQLSNREKGGGTAKEDYEEKNTVVFLSCDKGVITPKAVAYEEVFKPELARISQCFKEAGELAKKVSEPLSDYLHLLSVAVLSGDYKAAEEMRYRMTSQDSYLDIQLERNETYIDGVLGKKGEYNLRLSICDETPDPIIEKIRDDKERFGKLNMEGWLVLMAAGRSTRRAVSGNKLPNEEGEPIYKDVLLNNVSQLIQPERLKLAQKILVLEDGDLELILAAKQAQIRFHEASHSFGTSVTPHLHNNSNPVEECQAQTGSLILSGEMSPEHIRGIVLGLVAYAPIWMTIGLGGAHQKADILIISRLFGEGEEAIVQTTDDNRLLVDVEKAVPVIKRINQELLELEKPPEGTPLETAYTKAEGMFGRGNINRIADILKPVADKIMAEPVPFVVFRRRQEPYSMN